MRRLLVAALGPLEVAFPRPAVDVVSRLAYASPDAFEVRPWVVTATRAEGRRLPAFALRGRRAGDAD